MNRLRAFDKNGRSIIPGDILKVYHFTGRRRKKYYMYKQVLAYHLDDKFLKVSHLKLSDEYYNLHLNNKVYVDYEIVQCIDGCIEDRPKIGKDNEKI